MAKCKILYAEDDQTLAFLTQDNLEQNGYEVIHFADGLSALEAFKSQSFDLGILDIMLPKMDGFELATEIRKRNVEIPLIFLSAKTLKEDRIKGLRLGADDYLVKPFSIEELMLKIDIFLKRSQKNILPEAKQFSIGVFEFDPQNYSLVHHGEKTKLTQRESELLQFFIEHQNTALKREVILKSIWGDDDYFMGRSLDVFISRLRKILSVDPSICIENLHGIGFRFTVKPT